METRSKELWLIGYFLARFGNAIVSQKKTPPIEFNNMTWKEVYKSFYDKLGARRSVKSFENSLKNCRDTFDGHFGNSRRTGWRDSYGKPVKLPALAQSIFNKYSGISRELIWGEIKVLSSACEKIKFGKTSTNIKEVNLVLINHTSMKNPNWTREELILALDLYFNLDQGQMHKGHPDVIKVSDELIGLNIHKEIPDKVKFRNPSSVSRRLGNFKTMDSGYDGEGLANSGKLAKQIWKEFNQHRDKLRKEADLIRQLYLKPRSQKQKDLAEQKFNHQSEFLFQFHRNRETDPLVNKVKKGMVLMSSKSLKCEVCGFDSIAFYGEIGSDLMEIHYIKELKNEPGLESSPMEDFIIVCSNCHKVLDKKLGLIDADDLKMLIRKR